MAKQHGNTVTTFYLNGSSVLTQKTGDERIDFLYDDNSQLLGLKYNGTSYYYRKNLQGDITGILDPDGEQVVSYTYDAWGNPTSCTGSLAGSIGQKNPFRYRGYYYDTESGLYYTASRYYDPEVGRFLSPDAIDTLTATPSALTDKNLYAYCDNNPVMRQDSSGEFWDLFSAAVGAVVNVATTVISSAVTGQKISFRDVRVAAVSGALQAGGIRLKLAGALINTGYTFFSSLDSGASLAGAFLSGVTAGVTTFASVSNLAGFASKGINLSVNVGLDATFGFGGNLISAVTNRIVVDNGKQSQKSSTNKKIEKAKSSQTTSKNTTRTRRWHRYTYTAYSRDGKKTRGVGYYYF